MFRSFTQLTLALLLMVCISVNMVNSKTASSDATFIQTVPTKDSLTSQLAALVTAYADLDMFSGTVLVAKKGEVIYEGAFGEANKDHHVPNRMDTRFNIGSIGKTLEERIRIQEAR